MGRQQRYLRTQRRQRRGGDRGQPAGDVNRRRSVDAARGSTGDIRRPDPDVERFEEQRGRYGSFATWMVLLLLVATVAAIVATVVFWPD